MKLSQLINALGDDNVRFQNLDQCALSLDWSRKAGTRITFVTPETITPGEGTVRLGLVIWLDRAAVTTALASAGHALVTAPLSLADGSASDQDGQLRDKPLSLAGEG